MSDMEDRLEKYIQAIEHALAKGSVHEAELVEQEAQLKEALESRDVIGQAKGILMEREGLDDAKAFQMLTTISQRLNIKVRQVSVLLIQQTEDDQSDRG